MQQQINPIRRFNSNAQTPDSGITLHFLEVDWEEGDSRLSIGDLLKKHQSLVDFVCDVKLVDELAGEFSFVKEKLPNYASLSVIRATANNPNEKIGTISRHPTGGDGWRGKNLYDQSIKSEMQEVVVRWVAFTSLGGFNAVKSWLELEHIVPKEELQKYQKEKPKEDQNEKQNEEWLELKDLMPNNRNLQ